VRVENEKYVAGYNSDLPYRHPDAPPCRATKMVVKMSVEDFDLLDATLITTISDLLELFKEITFTLKVNKLWFQVIQLYRWRGANGIHLIGFPILHVPS
jgi:hypothetical protein